MSEYKESSVSLWSVVEDIKKIENKGYEFIQLFGPTYEKNALPFVDTRIRALFKKVE